MPETRGRWTALPKQSFPAFSGLSARESCLSVAALYCRMCVIRKSFSHAPPSLKTTSVTTRVPFLCFPRVDTTWTTFSKRFVTYLVERKLPRDLLILLWSPSGQQHVRLESPASSWHWGAWRPQPCKGTILPPADDILASSNPLQMTRWWPPSSRLQMTHDSSSTHLLQRLSPPPPSFTPAEDAPCRRRALIPCRGRLWTPCNLWDAQLKHLPEKVSAGAQSVLNLLMFSTYYCIYCIARALHCIVLNFELHVCNLIQAR